MNFYMYAANNPILLCDLLGLSWQSVAISVAEGVAVGALVAAAVTVAAPVVAAAATTGAFEAAAALYGAGWVSEGTVAAVTTWTSAGVTAAGAGAAGGAFVAGAWNTYNDIADAEDSGNWDQVGFDAGVFTGSALTFGYFSQDWSFASDWENKFQPNFDPSLTPGQNWVNGWATQPTDEGWAGVGASIGFGYGTHRRCPQKQ
jgi:hypothetical protein